jgi:acyl-CoA thioesterase-1
MARVEDVPGLPRVLLIGDSISIGYTIAVRELLAGQANVHRIPTNGGPTTNGLKHLDAWLGSSKWDVIHFNWGLHDLKYVGPNDDSLADPRAPTSRQQVPPAEYEMNLTTLVGLLKATGARLIWRNTTPIPAGSTGRIPGDELTYNAIAARVMRTAGITIEDLHAHSLAAPAGSQLPANVHYSDDGSRYLAEHVATAIRSQLPER